MIFVDSNIPMYLVGADDPKKGLCQTLVQQAMIRGETLVTDVEVFQEILHRYASIRRHDAINPAFDALSAIAEHTFPVEFKQVSRAREIVLKMRTVSARDAIHVAVMEAQGISQLMSFDAGFDQFPSLVRRCSLD